MESEKAAETEKKKRWTVEEKARIRSSPKVAVNFLPEKWNSSIIRRPKGERAF